MNNSSESNNLTIAITNRQPVKFWIFLIGDFIGICSSVFVLNHLFQKKIYRQALHNHCTILIVALNLFYQTFDIPMHMIYFSLGSVHPRSESFCLIWWFIDYSIFFIVVLLVLFSSIEKHLLIFHSNIFISRTKRLLFHYCPLILIVVSILTFYISFSFSLRCQNSFDYKLSLCGISGCYTFVPLFSLIERLTFSIIPSFLILLVNVGLLIRVIYKKRRLKRTSQWRKQMKMLVHILAVSSLYLCFDIPLSILLLIRLFFLSHWGESILQTIFFLTYLPVFLLPVVCIFSLPEITTKLKIFEFQRRMTRTQTQSLPVCSP